MGRGDFPRPFFAPFKLSHHVAVHVVLGVFYHAFYHFAANGARVPGLDIAIVALLKVYVQRTRNFHLEVVQ